MKDTRLRELTQPQLHIFLLLSGCRNERYPFEGIDTILLIFFPSFFFSVEMKDTRLRELTRSTV